MREHDSAPRRKSAVRRDSLRAECERQPRCESSREQNAYGDENSPLPRWSLRLRDERIEREWKAWKMLHDWI